MQPVVSEKGRKLKILEIGRGGLVLSVWRKQKALISFAVTAKLISAFVFAHAKYWFSHDATYINWV